jgi:hypothetical protein
MAQIPRALMICKRGRRYSVFVSGRFRENKKRFRRSLTNNQGIVSGVQIALTCRPFFQLAIIAASPKTILSGGPAARP